MDNGGKTALFHCMHPTNRHAKCLGFLLECRADPNSKVGLFEPGMVTNDAMLIKQHLIFRM